MFRGVTPGNVARARTRSIRAFILENLEAHPRDIVRLARQRYGISRQAVNRHLHALEAEGLVEGRGSTRARRWRLRGRRVAAATLRPGTPVARPDRIWRVAFEPALAGATERLRENARRILEAVVDAAAARAGATRLRIDALATPTGLDVGVWDDGPGLFARLARTPGGLELARFDLVRGARFGAPAAGRPRAGGGHAPGEPPAGRGASARPDPAPAVAPDDGSLLVAMRLADAFVAAADGIALGWDGREERWAALGDDAVEIPARGTRMAFHVDAEPRRTPADVLDALRAGDGAPMSRAHVPVALLPGAGEAPRSPGDARRLVEGLERCVEILLDFRGVDAIGEAFARELFGTWRAQHPGVSLVTMGASPDVRAVIRAALQRDPSSSGVFAPGASRGTNRSDTELMQ